MSRTFMKDYFPLKMREIPPFKPKVLPVGTLNVVEQLKKEPTDVSLCDAISIPK